MSQAPEEIVYVYNHDRVWLVDPPFGKNGERRVETARRRVHKLKRDRGRYTFEFVDEPGVVYTTVYGWSLVQDTPANVRALAYYHERRRLVDAERKALLRLLGAISLQYDEKREAPAPRVPLRWRIRWFLQGVASVFGLGPGEEQVRRELDACVDEMTESDETGR